VLFLDKKRKRTRDGEAVYLVSHNYQGGFVREPVPCRVIPSPYWCPQHIVAVSLGIELPSVDTTSGSNPTHKPPAVLIQNWIKFNRWETHGGLHPGASYFIQCT